MYTFEGNVNDTYFEAWETIRAEGNRVPSRNGDTYEVNPGIFQLWDPSERLVTAIGRPVNVAFALAEVLWILQGRKDVEMLAHYNARIGQWSDDGLNFNAPYGQRLREAHGWDQIEDVIHTLQQDPLSRQAILSVWNVKQDRGWKGRPPKDALAQVDHGNHEMWEPNITADRACNVLAQALSRDGQLNWLQVVRSNDLIWGVPYNFMQWTHVMEFIAASAGMDLGHYTHISNSLHVYDFNRPDEVFHFDLYQMLGLRHAPMQVLSMPRVYLLERQIREGKANEEDINRARPHIGSYWADVLTILLAHTQYKAKADGDALLTLQRCMDQVYATAQFKFYWMNRWSKNAHWTEQADIWCEGLSVTEENRAAIRQWLDDTPV